MPATPASSCMCTRVRVCARVCARTHAWACACDAPGGRPRLERQHAPLAARLWRKRRPWARLWARPLGMARAAPLVPPLAQPWARPSAAAGVGPWVRAWEAVAHNAWYMARSRQRQAVSGGASAQQAGRAAPSKWQGRAPLTISMSPGTTVRLLPLSLKAEFCAVPACSAPGRTGRAACARARAGPPASHCRPPGCGHA